jgi:glutaminyl-tRNA synthetase
MSSSEPTGTATPSHFIRQRIEEDLSSQKFGGRVATRFPPEPNGYLHIGHAKAICLNFGLAREFSGSCNLRMDDTDPTKEDYEYVHAIERDVRWLGFAWTGEFYASDYFGRLYEYARHLIQKGLAYVCPLDEQEMRAYRGTVTEAGRPSPGRDRSVEENLDLFARMRAGEFPDGKYTLRAKIDMASPNMKMRDPPMYRIRHVEHYRQGAEWCIYPMYDFAHCLSDALEGITHSICTLEFENNRELYDWFLEAADAPRPRPGQLEFARLNLSHTLMSKRKLLQLVEQEFVRGWDDPRMPTIAGLRRRGYTPEAFRDFAERIGVARRDNLVDVALLEHVVREDLNPKTARVMAVLRPLKVVIENYPEGQVEELEAPNLPDDPAKMGSRTIPFSRELYIEREDFMEDPPKKFFRLAPGKEVRLRWAYILKCERVIKDEAGQVVELRCTYDPATKGGTLPEGKKVKGTIHWVSAPHAVDAEVRLYDHLFLDEEPGRSEAPLAELVNPRSLEVLSAKVERSLADAAPGSRFQFERQGYFFADPQDCGPGHLVFNRTVSLKDSWAKIAQRPDAE